MLMYSFAISLTRLVMASRKSSVMSDNVGGTIITGLPQERYICVSQNTVINKSHITISGIRWASSPARVRRHKSQDACQGLVFEAEPPRYSLPAVAAPEWWAIDQPNFYASTQPGRYDHGDTAE
jgi:hypothetical protein